MKIRSIILVCVVFITSSLFAQSGELLIQGNTPGLHLLHTVSSKETWYSIGRLYNLSPKEITPFNNISVEKPLAIGQLIKIPLKPANFSQDKTKAADEVLVPVYHVVQEKEWMYRISQNYNKVAIEKLEQWNQIRNDDLKPGMPIVVGYLKVKPGQSALASRANAKPPAVIQQQGIEKKEEKSTEVANVSEKKPEVIDNKKTTKVPPVTQTEKKEEPPVTRTINYEGGYFRSQYDERGRSASGAAGIFRSTSGWQDGKYYALMNNVPVGTIIRVVNPNSGRAVYAKVLGNLPDMKESLGLTIRISDAAATELAANGSKFNAAVTY